MSVLTTRLASLNARHQREVKILTAARTLQKLNNTNKRMSKQTTEHLEQAEKRADTAERVRALIGGSISELELTDRKFCISGTEKQAYGGA